jgi:hypothetical protein
MYHHFIFHLNDVEVYFNEIHIYVFLSENRGMKNIT